MNTRTEANSLTGSAQSATGGFYISRTGLENTWYNSVELGDVDVKGGHFTDLTSTDGKTFYKIKYEANNALADTASETGYVEFDLYFLTGNTATNVYLVNLSIESPGFTQWNAEKAVSTANRSVAQGNIMEAELASALRVSFQEVEWEAITGSTDKAVYIFEREEGDADNTVGNTVTFNNTVGFSTVAENFAAKYYNTVAASAGILDTILPGISSRGDAVLNVNNPLHLLDTVALDNPAAIRGSLDQSFENGAKITVRVWLEGWDQEAFNALFSGQAEINMIFEVREP